MLVSASKRGVKIPVYTNCQLKAVTKGEDYRLYLRMSDVHKLLYDKYDFDAMRKDGASDW